MRTNDTRAQMVPLMQAAEVQLLKELEETQIVHVDLAEYAVGSPRYERLMQAISAAQKYQWPSIMEKV